jgi:hypothetical protein
MTDLTPEEALAAAIHDRTYDDSHASARTGDGPECHAEAARLSAALTAEGFSIVRSDELAGLRAARLDAALGRLKEDDFDYRTEPASMAALEPNEPDLWVRYEAIRSALEGVSR